MDKSDPRCPSERRKRRRVGQSSTRQMDGFDFSIASTVLKYICLLTRYERKVVREWISHCESIYLTYKRERNYHESGRCQMRLMTFPALKQRKNTYLNIYNVMYIFNLVI